MVAYVTKRENGQSYYIRTSMDSFDAYRTDIGIIPATAIARAILAEYDFIGIVNDPE